MSTRSRYTQTDETNTPFTARRHQTHRPLPTPLKLQFPLPCLFLLCSPVMSSLSSSRETVLRRGIASSPCTTESTHPSQLRASSSDTHDGVANEYTSGHPKPPAPAPAPPEISPPPAAVPLLLRLPRWSKLVLLLALFRAVHGGSPPWCPCCCSCCCCCWSRRVALSLMSMEAIAAIPPPMLCPVKHTLPKHTPRETDKTQEQNKKNM